jgi:uncharacterized short protein YbdD (DUF466 family)
MSDIMSMFVSHKEWAVRTARLMVGVPDYDTYVQHRQVTHPGLPVMTSSSSSGRKRATPSAKGGSEAVAESSRLERAAVERLCGANWLSLAFSPRSHKLHINIELAAKTARFEPWL